MELPEGTKRYGTGLAGFGATMAFAPLAPGDSATIMIVKLLPILLPILMDGGQKIAQSLADMLIAYHHVRSQVGQALEVAQSAAAKVEPIAAVPIVPPPVPKV